MLLFCFVLASFVFLFLKQSGFFCFNFKGNLAPESAVLKLSGKDIGPFRGPVSCHLGFSSIFFAIDSTSRNARQTDFVVYRAIKITFGQGGGGVESRLLVRTRQYFSLRKKVLRRPAWEWNERWLWTMENEFSLEHSIEKHKSRDLFRCPIVSSWGDPKRHVPLTFQRSFQKTIVNGKQPQSRFPAAHAGKFSLFPSSSPNRRPTISFQCLQTDTSQIGGFVTCSLSTFFNTWRNYWTY